MDHVVRGTNAKGNGLVGVFLTFRKRVNKGLISISRDRKKGSLAVGSAEVKAVLDEVSVITVLAGKLFGRNDKEIKGVGLVYTS